MIAWCLAHPWLALVIAAAVVITLVDMTRTLVLPVRAKNRDNASGSARVSGDR